MLNALKALAFITALAVALTPGIALHADVNSTVKSVNTELSKNPEAVKIANGKIRHFSVQYYLALKQKYLPASGNCCSAIRYLGNTTLCGYDSLSLYSFLLS